MHRPTIHAAAAAMSGTGGSPDAAESPQDPAAATEPDPKPKFILLTWSLESGPTNPDPTVLTTSRQDSHG